MTTREPLTNPAMPPHAVPRAHLVQLDIAWEDPTANFARVRELLRAADVRPGDLVLLPEMFDTGFSFNIEATNDAGERTLSFLRDLAASTGAVVQGGRTLAPAPGGRARNVATIVAPSGTTLALYAKQRLFTPAGEHERFEPGTETVTYPWGTLTVQPAICYDLRFPEVFRAGLRAGAQCIALGACWPSVRAAHWRALLIARAIENQCFVLGCNRVGDEPARTRLGVGLVPGLHYAGGSIIIDPKGAVLAEAGDAAGVVSAPIDAGLVREWREKFPAWREA